MNDKLPLNASRISILNTNTIHEPVMPVKSPTKGTATEVAEKNAAKDPTIKLTLKKLAIFTKLVHKMDELRAYLFSGLIVLIMRPHNEKVILQYSYKGTTQREINQLVFNQGAIYAL